MSITQNAGINDPPQSRARTFD